MRSKSKKERDPPSPRTKSKNAPSPEPSPLVGEKEKKRRSASGPLHEWRGSSPPRGEEINQTDRGRHAGKQRRADRWAECLYPRWGIEMQS